MPKTLFSTRAGSIVAASGDSRFLVLDADQSHLTPTPVGYAQAFRLLQAHRTAVTPAAE